jgi:Rps23 Pro-64 3,4-dihydroxylase Tpa1-like proline 4-hydroxylase
MIDIKETNGLFYIKDNPIEMLNILSEKYQVNQPFPHIVLDDFFPNNFLDKIIDNFPEHKEAYVNHKSSNQYLKKGYRPQELLKNPCTHYLSLLNSTPILHFLEKLTNISGLIPDPYYTGGGLHETLTGGHLDIHVDFSLHKKLNVARRLNMIIFLNKDWKPEYGGNLELWDTEIKGKVVEIEPLYNRCVIFNTDEHSYHGQPQPIDCPSNMTRRSIALYYYTTTDNINYLTDETKWKSKRNKTAYTSKVINRIKSLWMKK